MSSKPLGNTQTQANSKRPANQPTITREYKKLQKRSNNNTQKLHADAQNYQPTITRERKKNPKTPSETHSNYARTQTNSKKHPANRPAITRETKKLQNGPAKQPGSTCKCKKTLKQKTANHQASIRERKQKLTIIQQTSQQLYTNAKTSKNTHQTSQQLHAHANKLKTPS